MSRSGIGERRFSVQLDVFDVLREGTDEKGARTQPITRSRQVPLFPYANRSSFISPTGSSRSDTISIDTKTKKFLFLSSNFSVLWLAWIESLSGLSKELPKQQNTDSRLSVHVSTAAAGSGENHVRKGKYLAVKSATQSLATMPSAGGGDISGPNNYPRNIKGENAKITFDGKWLSERERTRLGVVAIKANLWNFMRRDRSGWESSALRLSSSVSFFGKFFKLLFMLPGVVCMMLHELCTQRLAHQRSGLSEMRQSEEGSRPEKKIPRHRLGQLEVWNFSSNLNLSIDSVGHEKSKHSRCGNMENRSLLFGVCSPLKPPKSEELAISTSIATRFPSPSTEMETL